jgi:hypothetical protein
VISLPPSPSPTDPAYAETLRAATESYFVYIGPQGNKAHVNISRTAPFVVRPDNVKDGLNFTLTVMLPSSKYPVPAKAPAPVNSLGGAVSVQRFPARTVAALYVSGIDVDRSNLEYECADLSASIPAGWAATGAPSEFVYYSGRYTEPAIYECWIEVKKA